MKAKGDITKDIDGNQTRGFYNRAEDKLNEEEKNILLKVLMITPENIHINSFMYEPILDTSIEQLKELYEKVLNLKD